MKKNISINISGIIFHIEEDGYENLRKYLDSINKYFSSFEDSSEILADIESRIAEIFLSKLNEGKQVITADDVHSLISTMGSVNDFKAAEEQEFSQQEKSSKQSSSDQKSYSPPKQLLRDQKRKTLGGVCSGIGSYLNVDPVWIRLIFALLAFVYGITIIAYIIMWIVVPGSYDLEEPQISKKMFRDSSRKVLGGVAGGLAAYLGIDVVAVRVLFIAFMFAGGLGFLIYIVLWVVLPEAKTLTDKMQMQGEPVTLSNIESNLKKNQNLSGNDNETALTKILLFPFRLIGMLLTGLARILGPIVDLLRVAIGIIIMLVGLALILSFVIAGGVLIGVLTGHSLPMWWGADFSEIGFPVEIFQNTFPALTVLAAFVVAVIPAIFIMLLGISAMAKRIVFGATVGWTLFVLFFASVGVLAISVPRIAYSFKEEGEYKTETKYQPIGKTLVLKINQTGLDDYKVTSLNLKGYDEKEVKLVQKFKAFGSTKQNAVDNAHMFDYHVDFRDSTLTFDSNIKFKKDAKFRAQELEMTLYIPYDKPFIMDEDASRFVSQIVRYEDLDGYTWKMTEKGLTCVTCPIVDNNNDDNNEDDNNNNEAKADETSTPNDLTDFDAIDMNGLMNATIKQGDNYSVELTGPEDVKSKYEVYKRDNTLVIENKNDYKYFWKRLHKSEIHINITMPRLEKLEAKGAGNIKFENFNTDNMELEVLGAMTVTGEAHTQDMKINVSGASTLSLKGSSENMDATILGASSLNAYNFEVNNANVEANGASSANIHVNNHLDMEEGIASHIDYRGQPEVNKQNN